MRQIGLMDVYHLARAALGVPEAERAALCKMLMWRAHVADKYAKRLRRLHPEWGDGSLRAAACAYSGMGINVQGGDAFLGALASVLVEVRSKEGSQMRWAGLQER